MRINKFIALSTGMGRRTVDQAIVAGRVKINNRPVTVGQLVSPSDQVSFDGQLLPDEAHLTQIVRTVMLNKPLGYVVSRRGQGSKTIYSLLPKSYQSLKPVGRLDKDSSGLLLLTSNGQLAFELTHPSHQKQKVYEITLDKMLQPRDLQQISRNGVMLSDGLSKLQLESTRREVGKEWRVTMHEGRNRQIRRTFQELGYRVTYLHRTKFGEYFLGSLPSGKTKEI